MSLIDLAKAPKVAMPWTYVCGIHVRSIFLMPKYEYLACNVYSLHRLEYIINVWPDNTSRRERYTVIETDLDRAKQIADQYLLEHSWKLINPDKLGILL